MQVPINTDLRKFKAKDIGNFTFKEAGFLVAGMIVGAVLYFIQDDPNIALCVIPAGLIIVAGFFKPFGLPMEEFLQTIFLEMFLYPKVLIWDSDYIHEEDEGRTLFGEDYQLLDFGSLEETDNKNQKKSKNQKKPKK